MLALYKHLYSRTGLWILCGRRRYQRSPYGSELWRACESKQNNFSVRITNIHAENYVGRWTYCWSVHRSIHGSMQIKSIFSGRSGAATAIQRLSKKSRDQAPYGSLCHESLPHLCQGVG